MEPTTSGPAVVNATSVSLALAQELLAQVQASSRARSILTAAVVVDCGGHVVASAKMDGAQLGAMGLASDKAFTAAAFGHPSSRWTHSSTPGNKDWGLGSSLGGRISVVAGGVPILVDGRLVGGLGVSGAAADVDEQCAREALQEAGLGDI